MKTKRNGVGYLRNQHDSYTDSASDNEINSKEIHLEDIIYTVVALTNTH